MAELGLPLCLASFCACLVSLAMRTTAEVPYKIELDEPAEPRQRLLLILLDGFRHDYLDHPDFDFPGFRKVIHSGAKPKYLIPDFPTLSYPNYYSLMTGLHTESHGMTGNYMYDVKRKDAFLLGRNPEHIRSHWWDGAEPLWVTAVKQNRTSYMYYWPGCEVEIHFTRPTFCEPYKTMPSLEDFRQAIGSALMHLQFKRADVAGIYFELTDSLGHQFGPRNEDLMQVIIDLDPLMGYLAESVDTLGNLNLMIVSDHGMTSVSRSRVIDLNGVIDPSDYYSFLTDAAVANIYTKKPQEEKVYIQLKNFHPNFTVYRKNDLPDRWHYKHGCYVAPLTGVADLGWYILGPDKREFPMRRSDNMPMAGWHGFDNSHTDMMGIFIGMGPGFRENVTVHSVHIVDLYQIMCHLLDLEPSAHDGDWLRVAPLVTFDLSSASRPLASRSAFVHTVVLCVFSVQFWHLRTAWL